MKETGIEEAGTEEAASAFMEFDFKDQDFRAAMTRALRTVAILAVIGTAIAWLALGWRSAALFAVGAAISATGIMVWQRLMGAILDRLSQGVTPRPLVPVLLWFVTHMLLSGALLYGSLRGLEGSVYALIAGLGLVMIALLIEAARLFKVWSH